MAICKECGAEVPDTSVFCGNCGAAQHISYEAPVPDAPAQPYAPPVEPARQTAPASCGGDVPRPPKGSRYAVVGSWGFFGTLVLFSIPVVGWIFTIVWACGGVHNNNLQRLARAYLIWWAFAAVATVLSFVLGGLSFGAIANFISNL